MSESTLVRSGERPGVRKGHGTSALGPSDSSDTGSDVRGGPGFSDAEALGLLADTTSDARAAGAVGAGADLGDVDLDSDTDRYGTGERAAAGRDATPPADRMLHHERGRKVDGDDLAIDAIQAQSESDDGDDADLDTTLETGDVADLDTTLEERDADPRDVERGSRPAQR